MCGKDAVSPLRLKTYRQGSYRAALAKCSTCDCNAGKDQITTRIQRYPEDARGQTGGTVGISRWALVHLWMVCNVVEVLMFRPKQIELYFGKFGGNLNFTRPKLLSYPPPNYIIC